VCLHVRVCVCVCVYVCLRVCDVCVKCMRGVCMFLCRSMIVCVCGFVNVLFTRKHTCANARACTGQTIVHRHKRRTSFSSAYCDFLHVCWVDVFWSMQYPNF